MEDEKNQEILDLAFPGKGITRRDFMKYCGLIATALGLEASFIPKIAQALEQGERPPVIWLHFAECTGCSESFLRASNPSVGDIILSALSVEYHETIMAPSGEAAHKSLTDAVNKYKGEFVCVCEGAIPTAKNGIYGMIGNKTMLQIARDVVPKAKAVICYGTCSSYGGLPAAAGNVTGAKSVHTALGGYPTINIPGCPPNPFNLVSTIVNYLLLGNFPALDAKGRPQFAYGNGELEFTRNHDQCPLRYVQSMCLRGVGCRGPETWNNCPNQKFNLGASWPIQVDAPCYGCSEPEFWDKGSFYNYDGTIGWGDGTKKY
jgi:[NiFe] hydrogenase small subunit